MPKIKVLPKEIAELIAAGEVVERPASVIKELMENAIDAGSSSVTVEIKNGGITYIRVTDNGCGISRDDIHTAFISPMQGAAVHGTAGTAVSPLFLRKQSHRLTILLFFAILISTSISISCPSCGFAVLAIPQKGD